MRKLLILAIAATPLVLTAPAFASDDDDEARCPAITAAEWLPMGEIETRLTGMGYQVRKLERERNCYEFEATDANGAKVEGYVNPKDGTLVPLADRKRS